MSLCSLWLSLRHEQFRRARCTVQAAMIKSMELPVLHITEADLVRDIQDILKRVQTGT